MIAGRIKNSVNPDLALELSVTSCIPRNLACLSELLSAAELSLMSTRFQVDFAEINVKRIHEVIKRTEIECYM